MPPVVFLRACLSAGGAPRDPSLLSLLFANHTSTMTVDTFPRLVGDVGGTNARFAWIASPGADVSDVATYPCANYPTLQDAMKQYLSDHAKPVPVWGSIGIANPVLGDHVQMTNHDWSFSIKAVQQNIGMSRFLVINDFTALALSLPALAPDQLRQVGPGAPVVGWPLGLLGAGTGLGVSGLLPAMAGHNAIPINGEGGHVTLAAANPLETQVIDRLRERFGHPSAERALSGPGLSNLYDALVQIHGETLPTLSASEITARIDSDPRCTQVIDVFFSLLGSVAGNLALTLGARGGMYIGGGIVPRLGARIDSSTFRERFESKGRFRGYLSQIPTFVIEGATSPALIGAARALEDL